MAVFVSEYLESYWTAVYSEYEKNYVYINFIFFEKEKHSGNAFPPIVSLSEKISVVYINKE